MSQSAGPLVSVLTPSYNQAKWLGDNLDSVAVQTYPRIEHIVMDGGSTDETLALLEQAGDSITWRSEPDSGQADAINKAFAASNGEIIGWLNSDDAYFDTDVVADVVALFDRRPDVDVVYGHCLQVDAEGKAIQLLWVPPFDGRLLHLVDPIVQPATFVRRAALRVPMLDQSFHFAMDYELWLRLDSAGRRFARIDRITAIDRHHGERKSTTIKDVHSENLERLATMYGVKLGAEHDRERSTFYVRQRLLGARLIPRLKRANLAFTAPTDFTSGLLRRQVLTRKSRWPDEYR